MTRKRESSRSEKPAKPKGKKATPVEITAESNGTVSDFYDENGGDAGTHWQSPN